MHQGGKIYNVLITFLVMAGCTPQIQFLIDEVTCDVSAVKICARIIREVLLKFTVNRGIRTNIKIHPCFIMRNYTLTRPLCVHVYKHYMSPHLYVYMLTAR